MDRFKFSSPGVFGAEAGARLAGGAQSRQRGGARAHLQDRGPAARARAIVLSVEFAGGGGWGDPYRREAARVREDVARDYVSVEAARDDYGVVLTPDARGRRRRHRAAAPGQDRPMRLRVGIDVGGTFTDVTAFDEERDELVAVRKYLSDPAQPAAVMEHITGDLARDFGADSVALILHGSTAALNTMLEGKGVRVGLLTTRGFRDVYEIGRQWRGEEVFNIFAPAPKMLLTRDRIFEVRERLDARGQVIEPLAAEDVAGAVRKLVADGVEAIAVCFLFAYANPAHEQAAAEIIRGDRARPLRLVVARGEPGMARIRAHRLDRRQRLYRSAGRALSGHAGGAVAAAVPALARADDEVRRRRRQRPDAGAHADPDRDVGAGRRRDRRAAISAT